MNTLTLSPHLHLIPLPQLRQEAALFGYHLPHLPDFLADHTLLGRTPSEHLAEVLGRFERFVIGLRKYRNTAYALRFISQPERGAVGVYLLGRYLAPPGQASAPAEQTAQDLSTHLTSYGLPHAPLQQKLGPARQPFRGPAAIVEIRQHERIVPIMAVNQEAYVIHPYWGPAGACLEPFEALLQQPVPVAISIYSFSDNVLDIRLVQSARLNQSESKSFS